MYIRFLTITFCISLLYGCTYSRLSNDPLKQKTFLSQSLAENVVKDLPLSLQKKAINTEETALNQGKRHQVFSWRSLFYRVNGQISIGHSYTVGKQLCRQYNYHLMIEEKKYNVSGSACRDEDGSWIVLE